jgi:hypothetical protein
MKRTLSMLIKLSWSEEEITRRIDRMRRVLISD